MVNFGEFLQAEVERPEAKHTRHLLGIDHVDRPTFQTWEIPTESIQ